MVWERKYLTLFHLQREGEPLRHGGRGPGRGAPAGAAPGAGRPAAAALPLPARAGQLSLVQTRPQCSPLIGPGLPHRHHLRLHQRQGAVQEDR